MEELLEDFLEQLETFQKSFKTRMSKANHLLWAEAEECRLLELLSDCSKQNQNLQLEIDLLLRQGDQDLKVDSSCLGREIQSLNDSIRRTSEELEMVESEIQRKEELISELSAQIEKISPPDVVSLGLPSEWKFLEGKQIEYEIISPRFLNDSEDSLKDSNEVTVFSPSNKVKRNTCKSLDMQANCFFDTEEFRRVYGLAQVQAAEPQKPAAEKTKKKNEDQKNWKDQKKNNDKIKFFQEFKENDEQKHRDEENHQGKGFIIEYQEESQLNFNLGFKEEDGFKQAKESDGFFTKNDWGSDVFKENSAGDPLSSKQITEASKWEEWEFDQSKDLNVAGSDQNLKLNLKILDKDEIQHGVIKENIEFVDQDELKKQPIAKGSQDLMIKPEELSFPVDSSASFKDKNLVDEQFKAKKTESLKEFQSSEYQKEDFIQHNTKIGESDSLLTEKHPDPNSPLEKLKLEPKNEENKHVDQNPQKDQPIVNSVKKEEPSKKFFKYQPRVIPKKIQAAKNQKDDFFDELL